eukprot:TRINITY_DN6133_c0_g1_i1.p1 TRINITY_DN6133_c0_g1~~TRINITY_DN6133_c0_g1_i1.p1  ORF type:complete len:179 (-),score=43.89 TRINITY_DN6133_c0_g1_i1:65-601(-)
MSEMTKHLEKKQKLLESFVTSCLEDLDDESSSETSSSNVKKEEANKAFLKYQALSRKYNISSNKPLNNESKKESDKENIDKDSQKAVPVRPPRSECRRCAKFFLTPLELASHLRAAKIVRGVCSSSGFISVKRSSPKDENEVARPRQRLNPIVEDNSPLMMPKYKVQDMNDSGISLDF